MVKFEKTPFFMFLPWPQTGDNMTNFESNLPSLTSALTSYQNFSPDFRWNIKLSTREFLKNSFVQAQGVKTLS